MAPEETRATLAISLLAAYADGAKHGREREEIRRIAEGLAGDGGMGLPSLYQDVLMKRVTLQTEVPRLASMESRQLAYEMAVCVCDADGSQSEAERAFLAELARALGLEQAGAAAFSAQAESVAAAPIAAAPWVAAAVPAAASPPVGASGGVRSLISAEQEAELDRAILNAAILNGALELLPESLSTLAIIPLQLKLVHRVGKAYGYELDAGHVKDFLATVGVGLTSQYLEQAGRKLLGGLLGKVGGGLLGGIGKQAVSSGMSFVTTYALGHVAKRYYAGGRVLSAQMLREAYADVSSRAKSLQSRHWPDIQQQARGLDSAKVMSLVRGG